MTTIGSGYGSQYPTRSVVKRDENSLSTEMGTVDVFSIEKTKTETLGNSESSTSTSASTIGLPTASSYEALFSKADSKDNRGFWDKYMEGGTRDGKISKDEVRSVVTGSDTPADVKAAGELILSHWDEVDDQSTGYSEWGGSLPGSITDKDIDRWIAGEGKQYVAESSAKPPEKLTKADFEAIFSKADSKDTRGFWSKYLEGGTRDGKISKDEVTSITTNSETSAEVKAAGELLLSNWDEVDDQSTGFSEWRGSRPGSITDKDIDKWLDGSGHKFIA